MGYSVTAKETVHQGHVVREVVREAGMPKDERVECLFCGAEAGHQYKGIRHGMEVWVGPYCSPRCAMDSVGHHTALCIDTQPPENKR